MCTNEIIMILVLCSCFGGLALSDINLNTCDQGYFGNRFRKVLSRNVDMTDSAEKRVPIILDYDNHQRMARNRTKFLNLLYPLN
ncbi:hypothetical protein V1505DRAFT_365245 [Lipomyces doorenjongii]